MFIVFIEFVNGGGGGFVTIIIGVTKASPRLCDYVTPLIVGPRIVGCGRSCPFGADRSFI